MSRPDLILMPVSALAKFIGTFLFYMPPGIRYLIEIFPTAGPAMNPMLGTAWAVFASSTTGFPQNMEHYYVYWISPILGAITASFFYAVYSGDSFFGSKLPFGPLVTIPIGGGPATPSAPPKKSD